MIVVWTFLGRVSPGREEHHTEQAEQVPHTFSHAELPSTVPLNLFRPFHSLQRTNNRFS